MSQLERPEEVFIRKTYLEDSRIDEYTRACFKEAVSLYQRALRQAEGAFTPRLQKLKDGINWTII